MKFNDITSIVGDIPCMSNRQGKLIYDLIIDNDITQILELGIAHGTGSNYMAAALDEKGKGLVTTIDNQTAITRVPSIHDMLNKSNLHKYVQPVFANSSYNWELMKLIEKNTVNGVCTPIFDFCFIDGAHNFEIDGCAFYLVDKLLKPGGYLLFDDVSWSYNSSPSLRDTDYVKTMGADERERAHVKLIVDLLVKTHPNYGDFSSVDEEDWFMTRKKSDNNIAKPAARLDQYQSETSFSHDLKKLVKKGLKSFSK